MKITTIIVGMMLFCAVQVANAQQLGIGTMGQGTSAYSMGSDLAKVLSDNRLPALVKPRSGTSSYLPLIQMGELDMGIANALEVGDAVRGNGDFKGRALTDIGPVVRLFPLRVGVFVRAGSGIETLTDLKGRTLTYGFTSQVTIQRLVDGLLAAGGLSPDIKPVMVPNVLRGADEFVSGRADAAFFALDSGKVSEIDASVGGLRILPLPDTSAALARMKEVVPEVYVMTALPAPNLAGIDTPIPMMAYDYLLVASRQVPDATISKVIDILCTNKPGLVSSFATFQDFDPDHPVRRHWRSLSPRRDASDGTNPLMVG